MNWHNINDKLPPTDRMVLGFSAEEPIVRYAVVCYEPSINGFIDYDEYPIEINYWMELPQPPESL